MCWRQWCALMLLPRLRRDALVLDLCCGTGRLTGALSEANIRVIGLDGSRRMLQHARRNAPGVPLLQADARQFGMRDVFDAVLCTFDSLNHLLTEEDLNFCFRSVSACLRPGGLFFFDLNTDHGYRLRWKGVRKLNFHGRKVWTRYEYHPELRLARFDLRLERFSRGAQAKDELVLWQRCHDTAAVRAGLENAHLSLIDVFGLQDGVVVAGHNADSERLFFLCENASGRLQSPAYLCRADVN